VLSAPTASNSRDIDTPAGYLVHPPQVSPALDDTSAARRACNAPHDLLLLFSVESRFIRKRLDNHSAHIFKETHAFLSSHPNRFQYVLTPQHGSWLNIVETLFGKMARTFLRHIGVQSLDQLKARILKGIEENNAAPVVHRWKNFEALV